MFAVHHAAKQTIDGFKDTVGSERIKNGKKLVIFLILFVRICST